MKKEDRIQKTVDRMESRKPQTMDDGPLTTDDRQHATSAWQGQSTTDHGPPSAEKMRRTTVNGKLETIGGKRP